MENHIVDLHLSDRATRQKWQQFLESLGIHNFSDAEVDKIDLLWDCLMNKASWLVRDQLPAMS